VVAELDAGAELVWDDDHGDEVVYVVSGGLEIDGTRCGPESSVIVESGVATTARAEAPTRLLHFGPTDAAAPSDGFLGAPARDGRTVHVVDEHHGQTLRVESSELDSFVRYYADSTCPTCRITFFRTVVNTPYVAPSHVHSEDEIIHVLAGELQVGRATVSAGMSMAIPKDLRYGFRASGPFSFLNYRRDISTIVNAPGSEPILENLQRTRDRLADAGIPVTLVTGMPS
jgi:hypothetical protein